MDEVGINPTQGWEGRLSRLFYPHLSTGYPQVFHRFEGFLWITFKLA